jgi:hypothetical protein
MPISNQIGASSLIKPGVIDSAATRPASPYEGQVIFQKDTDQLLVWNGTAWVIPNSPAQNPQGLELVKTQTIGSGITSPLVSNCFSSTYDNYRVAITDCVTSANGEGFGVRTVTDATGYRYGGFYVAYTSATLVAQASNGQSYFPIGFTSQSTSYKNNLSCEIYAPFLTQVTRFISSNASVAYNTNFNGLVADATSTTDLTVLVSSGTMTGGTIRVYGYRNS